MFEKRKLNKQKILWETRRLELAMQQLGNIGRQMEARSVKDEDEDKWIRIGGEQKSFSEIDFYTMRGQAYKFWMENVHGRAIIECLTEFIVGKEVRIIAQDRNEMIQEFWDEFEVINKFIRRQKEIVRRTLRDGECFIRYFVDVKEGTTKIRFIEPSEITDQSGKYSHGIQTDPDDIETPINYYRSKDGKLLEVIPAKEIQHIKILADSNVKRGTSFLYTVMPLIKKYEEWLNDRIILNKVRNCVALVISMEGATPSQIDSMVSQRTTSTAETGKVRAFKPGTIVRLGGGMKYDMVSPNLQAADVQHDGRSILLAIATATRMAEYMVTGDASNANYSSTMVSESPAVRAIENWQTFFEQEFKTLFRKVIQAGISYGPLPTQSEKITTQVELGRLHTIKTKISTNINCDIEFPTIISRNIKEETEAILLQLNNGLISRETARARLDYDPKEEEEKIEKEEAMSPEIGYGKGREKEIEKEKEEIPEAE